MRKKMFGRRHLAAAVTAAVFVAALLLVLGVGALPGEYTRYDMSGEGYYTLSEESRLLLDGLEDKVELVLLAVEGSEDLTLKYLLQRYADASRNISFRIVDPAADAELAADYAPDLRYGNSVAVVSAERKCLLELSEIYESDYSAYMESGDPADITSSFLGENAVTGAIRYVTSDDLPRFYALSGHGEMSLPDTLKRGLRKEGIVTAELDLAEQAVPADAAAVLIHAPSADLTADEREKLASYLADGGQLVLITAFTGEPLPELMSLMEPYGCSLSEGLVVEQDRAYYAYGYYDCLVPDMAEHEISEGLAEKSIVMPGSQGILSKETDGVTVTPLLTSSAAAYASTDLGSLGKKAGDLSGPLTVAALLEKGESRVVWYASGFTLDESYGGSNGDHFLSAVRYLCGSAALSIEGKDVPAERALTMSGPQTALVGLLFTLAIPLTFVIIGAVVLIRRRRRA